MNEVTYSLEVSSQFASDYRQHCEKNAAFKEAVDGKVAQILEMPDHFKPLHAPMQKIRRAHVFGSFVLLFKIIEDKRTVRFLRLAHHDEAYKH